MKHLLLSAKYRFRLEIDTFLAVGVSERMRLLIEVMT